MGAPSPGGWCGPSTPTSWSACWAHTSAGRHLLPAEDLVELLDVDLDALRGQGFDLPRTTSAYLSEWRTVGFLLRRPSEDSRGETLELSPEALSAIRLLASLAKPASSVTESRLASGAGAPAGGRGRP